MLKKAQISASGLIQGVGFRPFIYNLATRLSLSGFVQNNTSGVLIDVEGYDAFINEFINCLVKAPTPHTVIEGVHCKILPLKGYKGFVIEESVAKDDKTAIVSADLSICQDCLKGLFDTKYRRTQKV